MSFGLCYWILMLLWLVGVIWPNPNSGQPGQRNWRGIGGNILLFILLGLLGWAEFGAPLHK